MSDNKPVAAKWRFRLKLLIYPSFQLQFIGIQLLAAALTFSMIWWRVGESFAELHQRAVLAGFGAGHPYFDLLRYQEAQIFTNLLLAFGAGTLLSTLIFLNYSQRLAGPIVRLHGYFSEMRLGQTTPPPLVFRKADFFSDLPEIINQALGTAPTDATEQKPRQAA